MAWTAPMSAAAGSVFTAAQWNLHVRDNLLETETAKATAAGQMFVATAANAIAARVPTGAKVNASETTVSTVYAALTTAGPAVTVTTGTQALVFFKSKMSNNTADTAVRCSVGVSGATTITENDDWAALIDGVPIGKVNQVGSFKFFNTLTAGSNTFTMKYKTVAGTATFDRRELIVIPF